MVEVISPILNDILKVEGIEEAFSCFLVHRPNSETEKISSWTQDINNVFRGLNTEQEQVQLDAALNHYLTVVAGCLHSRMQLLMKLLESTVKNGSLPARKVCTSIIASKILIHSNGQFWIECFKLIRRIIDQVEYKGVREIMKVCMF